MSDGNLNSDREETPPRYEYQGTTYYTIEVISSVTRMGKTLVERCTSYGLINPLPRLEVAQNEPGPFFSQEDMVRLRRVRRLINDFGLNWAGVELVMRLTDELDRLRAEMNRP